MVPRSGGSARSRTRARTREPTEIKVPEAHRGHPDRTHLSRARVSGGGSASEDLGPAIEGATDHRLPFLGVSVLPGRRPANPLGHQPVVLAELPLAREALPLED